ncbi:MAG: HesA/MoeB/ThiF family protein [Wenzhouxiangellaceae bacterium]|nr:HesA/MoeB/ThiF family protein [Wenzhouxiangellaceae bacterium]
MDPAAIAPRYSRQALLPEIGSEGQARLADARVLCIGVGGLGCASLPYLAGAGVGHITLLDDDSVDRSNLQRQVLFGESDLGQPKAEAAARRLADLNPEITIEARNERLTADTVAALFGQHDLVLDGSDNYATKFLCGDASVRFGVPLLYASATGMEAMVTLFDGDTGPCLRCLFPQPPTGWVPNCAEAGVLGPLVGMAGCIQAVEAILWLANGASALNGNLWWLDARAAGSRQLEIRKRPDCAVCSGPRDAIELETGASVCPEIDIESARALDGVIFIDVRDDDEYRNGHIPGACHLPLARIEQASDLPLPEANHLVLYCAAGPRAERAAEKLKSSDRSLYRLRGGVSAWAGALVTGSGDDGGT